VIREYFNQTYGVKPQNKTAERAKKLCGKLAANPRTEEYQPVGAWWEDWSTIRTEEEE
jgi:hypothetical protein